MRSRNARARPSRSCLTAHAHRDCLSLSGKSGETLSSHEMRPLGYSNSQELDSETEASLAAKRQISRTPNPMHIHADQHKPINSQTASPKATYISRVEEICAGKKATYSHNNTTKAHIRTQSLTYPGAFPEWTKDPGKERFYQPQMSRLYM